MATTLKIAESLPSEYPAITGLTSATAMAAVWQRIETWVNWRWGERSAVFVVEGPGHWTPPLQPATVDTVEIWIDDEWQSVTPRPNALGGILLEQVAHYRVEATVGDANEPPAGVAEAARRLAAYFAEIACGGPEGAFVTKTTIDGVGSFEFGAANAAARALQNSGAADLLRPYRNYGGDGLGSATGLPSDHSDWSALEW